MQTKEELPPHPLTPEAEAYLASRNPKERALHELAVKMLGSSYFVERTNGFRKWKSSAKK
jgi:hypothetical protein